VTVVNIDNGFGAAYSATMILQRVHREATKRMTDEALTS
jgi:NCAIR mutase (PurE)-related protein